MTFDKALQSFYFTLPDGSIARLNETERQSLKIHLIQYGFHPVPFEPTEEMMRAGLAERDVNGSGPLGLKLCYQAMLRAAK